MDIKKMETMMAPGIQKSKAVRFWFADTIVIITMISFLLSTDFHLFFEAGTKNKRQIVVKSGPIYDHAAIPRAQ